MDILAFKIGEEDRVDIFINEENLIDMLREYEKPFGKKEGSEEIAGGYGGIFKHSLLRNLTSLTGKAIILGCQCGEEGCWPMQVDVTEKDGMIIWSNFEQEFRGIDSENYWNYEDFGELSFKKDLYLLELEKLKP